MKSNEFKKCKLGDVLNFRRGHDLPRKDMNEGSYPVIGSNGVIGYHNEYTTEAPSLTIGRSGNVGTPHFLKRKSWAHNTTLYVDDFKGNNPEYLFYLLKTLDLARYGGGSAVPTLNRNHIHPIDIIFTDNIKTQNSIAHILSTLDEKIETNNRINQTLQSISQLLFKHWFVDFEFPNEEGLPYKSSGGEMVDSELGMIPKGWEVSSLDNIADYLNGLAMQKYRPQSEDYLPVIKIKEMRNGFSDNTEKADINIPKQYIIHDGDILFSWSGTLDVVIWCNGVGGLNQHLFKVTSEKFPKWFYYLWTIYHLEKFKLIAATKATTMGHIKREDLSKAKVLIPNEEQFNEFNKIMIPLIEQYITISVENRELATLRDTLLPKLMSGEIDLSNLQID